MGTDLIISKNGGSIISPTGFATEREYVTMSLGEQLFGIEVTTVQDVLRAQKVAQIPLSRPEIAGLMNLRGRIVTVIDLRIRLGLPKYTGAKQMNVVVEYNDELYSLLVDSVGEVMRLSDDKFEKSPANLSPHWRDVSAAICRLKEDLLVVIDVQRLLQL